MIAYEQKIKDGGYKLVVNIAENILLRPNDNKLMMGEIKFIELVESLEKALEEDYKCDEIYKYYYELNNHKHGFCSFERWKQGLLF